MDIIYQNGSKLIKINQNGSKRTGIDQMDIIDQNDQNGSKWIKMDQNGSKWIRMDQNGPELDKLTLIDQNGTE